MNSGFSNLDTLKRRLLAPALVPATDFDSVITTIGLGVAASFEKYCNRKFQRSVGATFVCTADRDHCYLDRYPLEALTKTELKADINVGWELQDGLVLNLNEKTGLVYWGAGISFAWAQMRFTFTGGYFWETLEPTDGGYPSALPSGATAIPADLKEAWLLQCEIVWKTRDKLGQEITEGDRTKVSQNAIGALTLAPLVEDMIRQHRRMQLV